MFYLLLAGPCIHALTIGLSIGSTTKLGTYLTAILPIWSELYWVWTWTQWHGWMNNYTLLCIGWFALTAITWLTMRMTREAATGCKPD